MQRLFRPVRKVARPGVSRVRRITAPARRRAPDTAHRSAPSQDLSGLILYGQG